MREVLGSILGFDLHFSFSDKKKKTSINGKKFSKCR